MKKFKHIISVIFTILFVMNICLLPANAVENSNFDAQLHPIHISEFGAFPQSNSVPYATYTVGTLTQTKDAYLNISGAYAGTVTLHYETQMLAGRPQFVYENCYFTWSLDSLPSAYSVDTPNVQVTYTNDYISINIPVKSLLISDSITLGYHSYGTPD